MIAHLLQWTYWVPASIDAALLNGSSLRLAKSGFQPFHLHLLLLTGIPYRRDSCNPWLLPSNPLAQARAC